MGVVFFVLPRSASAAQLSNVFDRISTSRPSPSTPVNGTVAGGLGIIPIHTANNSRFLASDSATFISSGGVVSETLTVSSQSANLDSLYLTADTANAQTGNVVFTPITAMHTIRFTTVNSIPANGDIVIAFPGTGSTAASPSASTFAFNGLTSANASSNISTENVTCTWTVTAPNISCDIGASPISPGTTITIIVGCSADTAGECTTSVPRLINPTKSAVTGTADTWRLTVTTQDSGGTELDTAKLRIATIESVFVHAEVEPNLTFTIAGVNNGTDIVTNNAGCTGNTDDTNSGYNTTATDVNLGFLTSGLINIAAQDLTVSTNASTGYTITATSSGRFINPATGFWITDANGDGGLTANDTPIPAVIAAGTPDFGIHPCGTNVATSGVTWGTGPTSSTARYSNPWNTAANSYYATLTSYTGGPISGDETTVEYAAAISATTPAGIYRTNYTYVATATF